MQNKLQELTDKLYTEGLSKGRKEGEEILAKAHLEAEKIISEAKNSAEAIIAKAQKEAEGLKTKVETDLKMAARESIAATKQDIENLLVTKMSSKAVSDAMSSDDFVREIIKAVAAGFNKDEAVSLEVVLPETLKTGTEAFVNGKLGEIIGSGVEASFSKKITGGFKIGPKGQDWFISFTDETFRELISEYLRPATKKILFGE